MYFQVFYFYGEYQENFKQLGKEVQLHRGISEEMVSREKLQGKRTLILIDDLQVLLCC